MGRKNESAHFTATEILLMKALIVSEHGKLEAGYATLDNKDNPPARSAGVKKAFSSGTLTHNTLAAVAGLLKDVPPDDLAFKVKRGAGLITLGSNASANVAEFRAKDLAYRVWVQLSTRILAHPIDWDADDLTKVYDSWIDAFHRIRQLLEDAALWRDTDTALAKTILGEVTDLLNGTLRPHLTKQQGDFRHWLTTVIATTKASKELRPPARQENFPDWSALVADFERTQKKTAACRDRLHGLLFPQASTAGRRSR